MNPISSNAFDAQRLTQKFSFVDVCPENFLDQLITLPTGDLQERIQGFTVLRQSLLAGDGMPSTLNWPSSEIATPAREALKQLGMNEFLKDQPELVDEFLQDVLNSYTKHSEFLHTEALAQLAAMRRQQHRINASSGATGSSLNDAEDDRSSGRSNKSSNFESLQTIQKALSEHYAEGFERALQNGENLADASVMNQWAERVAIWKQISEAFGDLGNLLMPSGKGHDFAKGLLRHTGWKHIEQLRKLLETIPQLKELIQILGRMQDSDVENSVSETVFVPLKRLAEELHETRTHLVPSDVRGLTRSGNIARMLPSEAVQLSHPKLKMLWHARRTENALLSYLVEGIEIERRMVEENSQEAEEKKAPLMKRGPIIAVIDTSGSMSGTPETVAKALVLEAVRTATTENRKCYLYTFSSSNDVTELDLGQQGLSTLLEFLSHSFCGGSDATGVMQQVTDRVKNNKDWKKADVLFVSDGEWPTSSYLVDQVKTARDAGTRFHGVQVGGSRSSSGLNALCDHMHYFDDWSRVA